MKSSIFKLSTLFVVAYMMPINAQESSDIEKHHRIVSTETKDKHLVETNHFWSNWFITVNGGAQMYFSDHNKQMKLKDRFSPSINAGFGKWFTPAIGVRLMYNGYRLDGLTQIKDNSTGEVYDWSHSDDYTTTAPALYRQKIDYYSFHTDVMLNLTNLFLGHNINRFWHITPYFGFGYAVTDKKYEAKEITANLGLINSFRISNALEFNIEVQSALVHDRFDGEPGGRIKDGLLGLTAGFTYKFKKHGWNKSTTTTIYDEKELNRLREELNMANADRDRLKDSLDNQQHIQQDRIVEKEIFAAPLYVTFKINKWDLSKEARVSLGLLAEAIKKSNSQSVFTIYGYADAATGNDKINDMLSKNRAQVVYDCLTKEFNVPADRLQMEYHGGTENMFYDEPRLSRAVIMRIKE